MNEMPLQQALAHVAAHEGSRQLAMKRLLRTLGDEQIRARAGCVIAPRGKVRERMDQPLAGEFWHWPECQVQATVMWDDDIATISSIHPCGPLEAYRITVSREDLYAIWPAQVCGKEARRRERTTKADAINRQVIELTAKLRRARVRAPVKRAMAEIARQCGHASGETLDRWIRRNRTKCP
jgi:hypothetical protein